MQSQIKRSNFKQKSFSMYKGRAIHWEDQNQTEPQIGLDRTGSSPFGPVGGPVFGNLGLQSGPRLDRLDRGPKMYAFFLFLGFGRLGLRATGLGKIGLCLTMLQPWLLPSSLLTLSSNLLFKLFFFCESVTAKAPKGKGKVAKALCYLYLILFS